LIPAPGRARRRSVLRAGAILDSTRRGVSVWRSIVSRFTATLALRWRLEGRSAGFFFWGISRPPAACRPHWGVAATPRQLGTSVELRDSE
jgi:hypothetical protein